jgi:outer membrane protein assembly factor BamD (BamD/ComL family)
MPILPLRFETQSNSCRIILAKGIAMKRILGSLLIILTGFSVVPGYAFQQESSKLSEDQLKKAQIKIIAINRDMIRTREHNQAFGAFVQHMRLFLQQGSDSEYAPTVQQLLERMEEALASGDFRVAQFYADRGNYAGAILRLRKIIDDYPGFSRIDEVNQLYKALSTAK